MAWKSLSFHGSSQSTTLSVRKGRGQDKLFHIHDCYSSSAKLCCRKRALNPIDPIAAIDHLALLSFACCGNHEDVIPIGAILLVCARTTENPIRAGTTVDDIVTRTTRKKQIVAIRAIQDIIPNTPVDVRVRSITATTAVRSGSTENHVRLVAACNRIVTRETDKAVAAVSSR